jgi:hypothetical protein
MHIPYSSKKINYNYINYNYKNIIESLKKIVVKIKN